MVKDVEMGWGDWGEKEGETEERWVREIEEGRVNVVVAKRWGIEVRIVREVEKKRIGRLKWEG